MLVFASLLRHFGGQIANRGEGGLKWVQISHTSQHVWHYHYFYGYFAVILWQFDIYGG